MHGRGVDGDWLLIDARTQSGRSFRSVDRHRLPVPLDLDRIHAVAVSHLHADHCSGLKIWLYSFFALGRRASSDASRRPRLWYGLAVGMELIQVNLMRRSENNSATILNSSIEPITAGEMWAIRSSAGERSTACRFSPSESRYWRSCVSAMRRHSIRPNLIEWLAGADLIVHEATTMIHTRLHTWREARRFYLNRFAQNAIDSLPG